MPRAGEAAGGRGTALLALALALAGSPGGGQHYDYYGWQPEGLSHGRFYGREPQCLDIPPDMQLCRDVGYKRMRLPNLLEHESMAEAKQQASSWVPLLAKQCHTDTQLFLCSLFAPVCLDRPVYPCRSLCEVVRDSCAPVMESYGFPWPEMLHCGKFPSDHELCIAVQFGNSKATPPPGKQEGHCNGMGTHARHLPAVCPHASGDLHAGPPAEPLHPISSALKAGPGAVAKDPLSAGHKWMQYQQHQLLWLGSPRCPRTQAPWPQGSQTPHCLHRAAPGQ